MLVFVVVGAFKRCAHCGLLECRAACVAEKQMHDDDVSACALVGTRPTAPAALIRSGSSLPVILQRGTRASRPFCGAGRAPS